MKKISNEKNNIDINNKNGISDWLYPKKLIQPHQKQILRQKFL